MCSRPRGGGHVHCATGRPSRVTFAAPGRQVPTSWLQKAKAARRLSAARPTSGWVSRSSCGVTCTSGGADGEALTTLAPIAAAITAAQTSVPLPCTATPKLRFRGQCDAPEAATQVSGSGCLAAGESPDEDRHERAARDPRARTRLLPDADAVLALARHGPGEAAALEAPGLDGFPLGPPTLAAH